MTDVLGAIDASIALAERLYRLIRNFQDAPENARAHVLNSQLSSIRLGLLKGIAQRAAFNGLEFSVQRSRVNAAVLDLNAALDDAIKCLENSAPDDLVSRLLWAAWTGRGVTKLFNDIESRFSILQSLFDFMRWAPNLASLDSQYFNIKTKLPDYRYTAGAPKTQYIVQADLIASDNSNRHRSRPLLDIFVESYRPRPVSDKEKNKERDVAARTVARFAAERLWWTRVSENTAEVTHQTGVLPCIGYNEFRLIFMLPSNLDTSEDSKLKDLQPQTLANCIKTNFGVSLETRFSFALQLAEAVYKIHLAGLAHRAIRSNLILFLRPKPESKLDAQPTAGNEEEGQVDTPSPRERDIVRRLSRRLSFTRDKASSRRKGKDDAPGGTGIGRRLSRRLSFTKDKPTAEVRDKPVRRTASRTSMKGDKPSLRTRVGSIAGRGKEAPEAVDPDLANKTASQKKRLGGATAPSSGPGGPVGDPATTPKSGKIPPGFGSLYLTGWDSADHSGSFRSPRRPKRSRDIYMHPDLEESTAFYMGHDIYSLGVCLVEVGLWNLFVDQEVPEEKFGKLASRASVTESRIRDSSVGLETVKALIVDFAREELPAAMGEGYAGLVNTCLTCLDKEGPWKDAGHENYRERFRNDVLVPLRSIVSGFGSWRLETTA